MSLTSDDLPDPLTPVTATKTPSGISTVMLSRLLALAPSTTSWRVGSTFLRSRGSTTLDFFVR